MAGVGGDDDLLGGGAAGGEKMNGGGKTQEEKDEEEDQLMDLTDIRRESINSSDKLDALASQSGGWQNPDKTSEARARRPLPTYKQAVREVILQREEGEDEGERRLARMVMTRWRLPVDRRLFEEQLIMSLQATQEANMILRQFDVDACMSVNIGNDLDLEHLVSLQLTDLLNYRQLQLNIKCMIKDETAGVYRRLFTPSLTSSEL